MNRERLLHLLATHAYREGDVVLSSGRRSSYYLDAKRVTYHPDGVRLVGEAVFETIRGFNVQGVGGLTLGADAMVTAAQVAAALAGHQLSGFIVRKQPKAHGMKQQIEGVCPPAGSRVAILEDVTTSGQSILQAVGAAREAGLEVAVAVSLVDRAEGATEALAAQGVELRPIFRVDEIRHAAAQRRSA